MAFLLLVLTSVQTKPQERTKTIRSKAFETGIAAIDSLWSGGQRDSAVVLTEALLDRARAEGDTTAILDLLRQSCRQAASFDRIEDVERLGREGIELAWLLGDTTRVLTAQTQLRVLIEPRGRRAEAAAIAREQVLLAQAAGNKFHEAWARVSLGWHAYNEGRADDAIDDYRRAVEIFTEIEDTGGRLWALNGVGLALSSAGRYREAADWFRRTAEEAHEASLAGTEAHALNNLGTIEYSVGDPGRALELFERALTIREDREEIRQTIIPLTNIALCYRILGRDRDAEAVLLRGLQVCRDRGFPAAEASVLTDLAHLNYDRGRHREAARLYRETLSQGDELSLRNRAESLKGLGRALAKVDSLDVALDLIAESVELLMGSGEADLLAQSQEDFGVMLLDLGRTRGAIRQFRASYETANRSELEQEAIEALVATAEAYREVDMPDSSVHLLLEAAERWEGLRGLPRDPVWREQRGALGQRLHTTLAVLLIEAAEGTPFSTRGREAFDRLQAFKARTLLERILGPGEQLELQTEKIASGLIDLDRLQRQTLQSGELFLDFYVGLEFSVLFAVTRDAFRAVRLAGTRELDERLIVYHELLSNPPRGRDHVRDSAPVRQAGEKLFEILFGGIGDLIEASDVVIVSPDGLVSAVPLPQIHLLGAGFVEDVDAPKPAKRWMRVPSATILSELRKRQRSESSELAQTLVLAGRASDQGERLSGTVQEGRSLARRYRNVNAVVDPAETDSLEVLLQGPDILHIASHLMLDEQNPWQSEIQLHPSGSEANLRAGEVASLKLQADLAVLSSCSSARGQILSGEGVIGVTSAFLAAGVPTVVATLWPVDDRATADLMEHFYAALARGESAAGALSLAQSAVRAQPERGDPFYWAGFVLVGDGDLTVALQARSWLSRYLLLWVGFGLLLAVSVVLACWYRRGSRAGRL